MSEQIREWQVQKMCVDLKEYELSVEKQKTHTGCEQNIDSWKWVVSYHGTIVSSGLVNSAKDAQMQAMANAPNQK